MPKSVKSEDTRKNSTCGNRLIFGKNKILAFAHVLFMEFIIFVNG